MYGNVLKCCLGEVRGSLIHPGTEQQLSFPPAALARPRETEGSKKSIRDELINGNWKRDLPYMR